MILTYTFTYFIIAILSAFIGIVIFGHLNLNMGSVWELNAFRLFIGFFVIFVASNSIWIWIQHGYLHWNGSVNSIINLIAICLCAYFWFYYVEICINAKRVESRIFRLVSIAPLAIAIILVVTSPLTHWVFYYTEESEYIHGPLYSTMSILSILYMLIASAHLFYCWKHERSRVLRNEYGTLMRFLIYPLAGGIIDVFVPNLPVMELTIMLGIVTVFLSLQRGQIYNDSLTGLNNRRRADEYLSENLSHSAEDESLYVFLADADGFKEINDRYGHPEGDRALLLIADTLRRTLGDINCHVARWGGDEFILIMHTDAISSPDRLMETIDRALEEIAREENLPYPLRLTMGYAKGWGKDVPEDVIRRADEQMYRKKQQQQEESA